MTHDLTGRRFGKLIAVKISGTRHNRMLWLCQCDCGNKQEVTSNQLLRKNGTKSCGCLRGEKASERMTKHGIAHTRIYNIWCGIKKRCDNQKDKSYPYYGAKGIKYCDRWKDFNNFYEDMSSTYQDDLTIDRIDYTGDYEPDNCRWVTQQEQLNNYSRNVFITYNGETDTVFNMCKKYNIKYDRAVRQIKKGMDINLVFQRYKNKEN